MFCLLMWKRTSSLNAPIIWQQDPTFFSEMYPCSYFVIWDSTSRCLALPKPFGGQCCDSVSACGSELGMSFSPWGHLTMSGDISGCYSYRECYYHLACRGQRCCLGSYSGQDSHLQRGIIWSKMSVVHRLINPVWANLSFPSGTLKHQWCGISNKPPKLVKLIYSRSKALFRWSC